MKLKSRQVWEPMNGNFLRATKAVFALKDGELCEGIKVEYPKEELTFAISTQVGCSMDCNFCANRTMFKRNLTSEEMNQQVSLLGGKGTIALSGVGEPLENNNLPTFLQQHKRTFVSTIGHIAGISKVRIQDGICLTLLTPFEEERRKIAPKLKDSLGNVLDEIEKLRGNNYFVSFTPVEGLNDSVKHIQGVIQLAKERRFGLVLGCYQPVLGSKSKASESFYNIHNRIASADIMPQVMQYFEIPKSFREIIV